MTDAQERLAQLQARRAGTSTGAPAAKPAARRKPATGSKIAAAGVGMTVMFGLVGAMALAQGNGTSTPAPAVPAAPAQVVVVIHRDGGTSTGTGTGTVTGTPVSSGPITLTAQPVVRQAPVAAPVTKTNGSR